MGRKRRNSRPSTPPRPLAMERSVQSHPDGDWHVRPISGAAATKNYRCPGCQQEIRPGTPHVVAWRDDVPGGAELRRHWHTPCWNARDRRRPG